MRKKQREIRRQEITGYFSFVSSLEQKNIGARNSATALLLASVGATANVSVARKCGILLEEMACGASEALRIISASLLLI